MTDESTEQKRQRIIESFDREQRYFEKSFEENAERLSKATEVNNSVGIDLAKKNMGEANEILGDLLKQKNEALSELQAAQTTKEENSAQETPQNILEEKVEEPKKSEEEDYNYGYGM